MPQYLAPGVFVEETDTGNKPIEGVSTSTTGLVGVTERGPANVPTLVTSFGDFRRIFGRYLPITGFTDPTDRAHCYLPHAAEGFFTNGGKRAYITRVTAEEATRAERRLFFDDSQALNDPALVLLRAAEESTGTGINPPLLCVLSPAGLPLGIGTGETVRVGDGSRSEYRVLASNPIATPIVTLNLPLQGSHPIGTTARAVARAAEGGIGTFQLVGDTGAGATELVLKGTDIDLQFLEGSTDEVMEIGAPPAAEYVQMVSGIYDATLHQTKVTLAHPTQRDHKMNDVVTAIDETGGASQALTVAANGGDSILYVDALGANFNDVTYLIVLDDAGAANREVRRIGDLKILGLALPTYEDYPVGTIVAQIEIEDDTRTVGSSDATFKVVTLTAANGGGTGIVAGMQLTFTVGADSVTATVSSVSGNDVALIAPLPDAPSGDVIVQPRTLTAAAAAGSMSLSLDTRIGLGIDPNNLPDIIRVGTAPNHEYVTVTQISEPRRAAPDAGNVILDRPLQRSFPAGAPVMRQTARTPVPPSHDTVTLLDAPTGATQFLVADGSGFSSTDTIRVTLPSGDQHYHLLDTFSDATPSSVVLDRALARSHAAGSTVVQRQALFTVRALDTGGWGNRVLVTVADEEIGLLGRATVTAVTPSPGPGLPSTLRLSTVTGVEVGTVLELRSAAADAQIGDFVKVRAIDRAANNLVILDPPGITPDHVNGFAANGNKLLARSRELRMQVLLLQPPSPAVPTRNQDLQDQELFRQLSMDPRHSHYFERIIGSTFTDGADVDHLGQPVRRSDRRSQGGSRYVRVHDLGTSDADKERVRLGPEALIDILPSSLTRPARFRLGEGESLAIFGDDSVATMGDSMYVGVDDREPVNRTGIYALKNLLDVALVAVPGQVTPAVQQALIDHCELLRYRFAVLDAQGPSADTLDDIQAQRQQFDTKYAAFYHPWLTISDPFPTNLTSIAQFPIPPSGHVLGIYARTDDQRGVHKAPANEVVAGMTGLTRYLNQGEQEILNAYPVNIDVIRDFRANNRGIRVWGARCITSDSDWKYVNVRRLLIFIEDSLDRGLQWVVFEPNAEALWARVRRSVGNFLTTLWRNGALEGETKEQGFYVKCDRTTMTQDDIDNGRLICVIGVAPVKPAEFVIIRIGLWTADASS